MENIIISELTTALLRQKAARSLASVNRIRQIMQRSRVRCTKREGTNATAGLCIQ
jgi:hypothetical protein